MTAPVFLLVLVAFLSDGISIHKNKLFKEGEGLFWLVEIIEFIMVGKPWQQKHKETGHIGFTVRKQKKKNQFRASACFVNFICLPPQPIEC